jgi:hypothetical protein
MFLLTFTCVKPPNYPDEPVIRYNLADGDGFNKLSIAQGSPGSISDTLTLTFSFTDGDGDLGFPRDSFDIFFTDSRTADFTDQRRLPVIPDEGIGNGIEGKIVLRFPNQPLGICCISEGNTCQPQPGTVDTFSYTLQIKDRAGNFSNKIQTETVTILCD